MSVFWHPVTLVDENEYPGDKSAGERVARLTEDMDSKWHFQMGMYMLVLLFEPSRSTRCKGFA